MSLPSTNLLQTVPERMARRLAGSGDLVIKDIPFDLQPSSFELMWHVRNDDDPRHRWFRQKFIEAARSV